MGGGRQQSVPAKERDPSLGESFLHSQTPQSAVEPAPRATSGRVQTARPALPGSHLHLCMTAQSLHLRDMKQA